MVFCGKVIGKSEQPIYDAARWLLANNAASENDTVATYRGTALSMHGVVGFLAGRTVVETKKGNPSMSDRRWVPFPGVPVGSQTDEEPLQATMPPETSAGLS